MTDTYESLKAYLNSMHPGIIEHNKRLESLLVESWHEFENSGETSMTAHKLRSRIEQVEWHPPLLKIQIERHGVASLGSKLGELQQWTLDIAAKVAKNEIVKMRRIVKYAKRLSVEPIAKEIAALIVNCKKDERLKWIDDKTVRILISKVIPKDGDAAIPTIDGRRKRFRKKLDELLPDNWKQKKPNVISYSGD